MKHVITSGLALYLVSIIGAWTLAHAQQTTGVPGSPSATTTIDGQQIPPPPQKFGGKIERSTEGSRPYWPASSPETKRRSAKS